MRLKLHHTRAARQDLKDIWTYGSGVWGEDRAEKYLLDLEAHLKLLCGQPEVGKVRAEFGENIRTFPALEHIIIYRIQGKILEVVRLAHAKSDYAGILV